MRTAFRSIVCLLLALAVASAWGITASAGPAQELLPEQSTAKARQLLQQVITALGGVFGILLSYAVSISVGRLTLYSALAKHAEAGDIRLIVSPMTLLIATTILVIVGIISGMVPAMRAANLDPIEALRYE